MLVDEHADRDAAHVKPVQKVLDVLVGDQVLGKSFFIFYDTLSHGGHHVVMSVSDGHQSANKPEEGRGSKEIQLLEKLYHTGLYRR